MRSFDESSRNLTLDSTTKEIIECEAVGCNAKATTTIPVPVGNKGTISVLLCQKCISKFEQDYEKNRRVTRHQDEDRVLKTAVDLSSCSKGQTVASPIRNQEILQGSKFESIASPAEEMDIRIPTTKKDERENERLQGVNVVSTTHQAAATSATVGKRSSEPNDT